MVPIPTPAPSVSSFASVTTATPLEAVAHGAASPSAPASLMPGLQHLYASQLPELCVASRPARAPRPALQVFNHALALELGWPTEALDGPLGAELFSGNAVPDSAQTVAQGYAGHQFGGYSPQLGDGRALLLGEVRDAAGQLRDVAFKGSGRTPFSRGGDGKAALGPMLREYLVSEAMHALGVPTTRSLAVATTGERIRRDSGAVPAAVLTRVAASHIRVGTFQWVAAQGDEAMLRRLADFTLARHFPELTPQTAPVRAEAAASSQAAPSAHATQLTPSTQSIQAAQLVQPAQPTPAATYLALLAAVCQRQAALVAQWMGVGFVHGVMNTDNMTLSGETIDYGPCAFMEACDADTVFSSIDHGGRYAWGNQPGIARWNLTRLAETLLPLLHPDVDEAVALAGGVIHQFSAAYQCQWLAVMRAKLGLVGGTKAVDDAGAEGADVARVAASEEVGGVAGGPGSADDEADLALIQGWLTALQGQGADWTLAHRYLCDVAEAVSSTVTAAMAATATHADAPLPTTPARASAASFAHQRLANLFADPAGLAAWLPRWQARLLRNPSGHPPDWANAMRRANPIYIPRNQLVEEALSAASDDGNLAPFHVLLAVVQHPFDEVPGHERYAQPGQPEHVQGYRTFCGT